MNPMVKDAPKKSQKARFYDQRTKSALTRKRLWLTLAVATVMLLAGLVLLEINWPFTRSQVIANLEDRMQGTVTIGKFHRTYFPHLGGVAEDVTFTGYGNLPNTAPITVRKLTIQGSFRGLFTKHVPVMRAEGAHVIAASAHAFSGWKSGQPKSKAVVDELIVAESVLEFSRGSGTQAMKFEIAELSVSNPGTDDVMRFETVLRNPMPPGEVRVSGSLGPWRADNLGQTPLSGIYSFRNANLGVFHGIAGTLSSEGSFEGIVQQLKVRGKTDTPDFEVTDTGHKIGLSTQFQARVNTGKGDVVLEQVTARLGKSGVNAQGSVAGRQGEKGKTTSLGLTSRSGRIQDFLYLFLKDRVPPMTGLFSFRGQAVLPPGKEPFTERIQLEGDFGVGDATLSNPTTQTKLEELSERAEAEKDDDPERVVSELKGHALLRQGIATFSRLSFRVPGAVARLHGTYSLISHRIDLHGRLSTKATLPQATSGVKSFLLKIINPVLKKNHRGGGVVALTVTGIYPHPDYKTVPIADPM